MPGPKKIETIQKKPDVKRSDASPNGRNGNLFEKNSPLPNNKGQEGLQRGSGDVQIGKTGDNSIRNLYEQFDFDKLFGRRDASAVLWRESGGESTKPQETRSSDQHPSQQLLEGRAKLQSNEIMLRSTGETFNRIDLAISNGERLLTNTTEVTLKNGEVAPEQIKSAESYKNEIGEFLEELHDIRDRISREAGRLIYMDSPIGNFDELQSKINKIPGDALKGYYQEQAGTYSTDWKASNAKRENLLEKAISYIVNIDGYIERTEAALHKATEMHRQLEGKPPEPLYSRRERINPYDTYQEMLQAKGQLEGELPKLRHSDRGTFLPSEKGTRMETKRIIDEQWDRIQDVSKNLRDNRAVFGAVENVFEKAGRTVDGLKDWLERDSKTPTRNGEAETIPAQIGHGGREFDLQIDPAERQKNDLKYFQETLYNIKDNVRNAIDALFSMKSPIENYAGLQSDLNKIEDGANSRDVYLAVAKKYYEQWQEIRPNKERLLTQGISRLVQLDASIEDTKRALSAVPATQTDRARL